MGQNILKMIKFCYQLPNCISQSCCHLYFYQLCGKNFFYSYVSRYRRYRITSYFQDKPGETSKILTFFFKDKSSLFYLLLYLFLIHSKTLWKSLKHGRITFSLAYWRLLLFSKKFYHTDALIGFCIFSKRNCKYFYFYNNKKWYWIIFGRPSDKQEVTAIHLQVSYFSFCV